VLCVPICHNDELLGVVQVLNPKDRPVFNHEDLELLESFAHLASVALFRRHLLESRLREERMSAQLEAASEIQKTFLPSEPVEEPGFTIWGNSRPAIFVGGDLFSYFPLDDGSWVLVLADVSGKGLPAAMVMSAMTARIYSVANTKPGVSGLLQTLNGDWMNMFGGAMFATVVAAKFDPSKWTVEVGLAGHLPPLIFTPGAVSEMEGIKGMPLGIDAGQRYETMFFDMGPGESLVFISDGVTEARNASGDFFEMDGVRRYAAEQAAGLRGPGLIRAVDHFRDNAEANDDTTVLEIHRKNL
jgi:serine phosphatase RsbU (regulator of sigma subunit)